MGNESSTAASYPAGYPGVIGVAASRKDPQIAAFSDCGPSAYIAAPGVDIQTLAVGGGTTNIRGTSAAAAEVAGAAALLLATGAVPSGHRPAAVGPPPSRWTCTAAVQRGGHPRPAMR